MRSAAAFVAFAVLVVLAACTQLAAPTLIPTAVASLRVGQSVVFVAAPMPDGVLWMVDSLPGGNDAIGTISASGVYTAPARVPPGSVVTVTAIDAVRPHRRVSAEVTVIAPGTLYVYDSMIYVYNDMDTVDGNATPDRSFVLDGIGSDVYDMTMAPMMDTAFIAFSGWSTTVYRVPDVSTADGTVTVFTAFDPGGYTEPSGVAYDPLRDVLYVRYIGGLLAYDVASVAGDDWPASREVSGPSLADFLADYDVRLAIDPAADRLFLVHPNGTVGVYDDASTIDGEVAPDRTFTVDTPTLAFLWGAAYDAGRDELYLGDQRDGEGVYVIAGAATAEGAVAPSRIIGGPTNPLEGPSMVSYDALNDRLVVVLTYGSPDGVAVFDDASTVDGDVARTRWIRGSELPLEYPMGGYLDPTQ